MIEPNVPELEDRRSRSMCACICCCCSIICLHDSDATERNCLISHLSFSCPRTVSHLTAKETDKSFLAVRKAHNPKADILFSNFESEFSKVFFGIAALFYPKLFRITSHAQSSPRASALHPSAPISAPLVFAPVSVFQLEPSRLRWTSERAKSQLSGRKRDFPAACQRTESLSNVTTGQVAGIKLLSTAVLLADQEETNNPTFFGSKEQPKYLNSAQQLD